MKPISDMSVEELAGFDGRDGVGEPEREENRGGQEQEVFPEVAEQVVAVVVAVVGTGDDA